MSGYKTITGSAASAIFPGPCS